MKPGLSLRVSQHLTLTPQLQQSIRLLQLSTLELAQEIEQMLDENPFLERADDDMSGEQTPPEAFGSERREGDESGTRARAEALFEGASEEGAEGEPDGPSGDDSGAVSELVSAPDWSAGMDGDEAGDDAGDGAPEFAPDDGQWVGAGAARGGAAPADAAQFAHAHESLYSHLHQQALALHLNAQERAALHFLIESLNEEGYLEDSLHALAASLADGDADALAALMQHFQVALNLLQSFDPPGVGARDLGECLSIQLRQLPAWAGTKAGVEGAARERSARVALAICERPAVLALLAKRDIKRLAVLTHSSLEQVRAAMQLIARLEPKPGRRFADVQNKVIVPDVIVTRNGNGSLPPLLVQLNPEVLPRLRVHELYAEALRPHKGEKGDKGLKDDKGGNVLAQRLQEARWFIRNIQQRFDTILRVAQAIVQRQKKFFEYGEIAMCPLVLREIADELGLHESTISRVTTAKYMATPLGTFEFKYFFGSALGTETGGNASSTAVRALLKQFVAAENPGKPLSDGQLSDMLKEQGIECARRTVAKYREALRIAPAHLRKRV
ncbi:MAG: RNA polymerase factor sigma-54 [Burkholderiaceae bacterium]|jgi:RNA polymerase sigma-54 factor|nr:RNA polymerase factor sigma-54 [Burkholderiaceae bacterium]